MRNDSNEHIIATVSSATDGRQRLENKVRYMLDQLVERLNVSGGMPYGMTLEGRLTLDRFGNQSLYVYLKVTDAAGDSETFSGQSGTGNEGDRIPETVGGKWIRPDVDKFNAEWEAQDLRSAIKRYRAMVFAAAKAAE